KRGHSHGRALLTIGDRLLAVACAMLKSQTPFDPATRPQSALSPDHPLVRQLRPSLRPDLPPGRAPRAAEVTPKGAQRSGALRSCAVDAASTALSSFAEDETKIAPERASRPAHDT